LFGWQPQAGKKIKQPVGCLILSQVRYEPVVWNVDGAGGRVHKQVPPVVPAASTGFDVLEPGDGSATYFSDTLIDDGIANGWNIGVCIWLHQELLVG
jgi:hypothetical protein